MMLRMRLIIPMGDVLPTPSFAHASVARNHALVDGNQRLSRASANAKLNATQTGLLRVGAGISLGIGSRTRPREALNDRVAEGHELLGHVALTPRAQQDDGIWVAVPDELLQRVASAAEQLGESIDELYVEALARYVDATKDASSGSLRSRGGVPMNSPKLSVELPEDLFESADKLAKRLGKKREVLYPEALARHVAHVSAADSALDQGHDLPKGAWDSTSSDRRSH